MAKVYNENDGYVGFWCKDISYQTGDVLDDYNTGSREYLNYDSDIKKNIEKNCKNTYISNYFGTIHTSLKTVVKHEIYKNGRKYYEYSSTLKERKNPGKLTVDQIIIPNPPSDENNTSGTIAVCQSLSPFNGINIELASLICSQFSNENTTKNTESNKNMWPALFKLLTEKSAKNSCTSVGYKIAKSLIKIAALRIFADPEQSIIELPVNSMDSYVPEMKVGKFGMGFFSFLYWLIDHPLRTLYIYSWFKSENTGNNNGVCGYVATLKDEGKGLTVNLRILETYVQQTGTFIYLDTFKDKFDVNTLNKFESQLDKLKKTTQVKLTYKMTSNFNNGPDTLYFSHYAKYNYYETGEKKTIFLGLNYDRIFIEDYANGISINTLLGSLFVPSISTKTLKDSLNKHGELKALWKPNNTLNTYGKTFVILVSNVAVVSLPIDGAEVSLDMPPWTRLPVSRDDIILDENTAKSFEESVKNLVILGVNVQKNVSSIQDGLYAYYNYTSNSLNKQTVNKVLSWISTEYSSVLTTKNIFFGLPIDKKSVLSRTMDIADVEERLIKDFSKNIIEGVWYGKRVIPSATAFPPINTFGMASLVFVSEEYMKIKDWNKNGSQAYPNLNLGVIGTDYGKDKEKKYNNLIPDKLYKLGDKKYIELYLAVMTIYDGLNVYFSYNDKHAAHISLFKPVYDTVLKGFDIKEWVEISYAILAKLSSFKGNQTYGGQQYKWSLFEFGIMTQFENADLKLKNYRVQSCLLSIESVTEQNITLFTMAHNISPNGLYAFLMPYFRNSYLNIFKCVVDNSYSIVEFTIGSCVIMKFTHTMLLSGYKIGVLHDNLTEFLEAIKSLLTKIKDLRYTRADVIRLYTWVGPGVYPTIKTPSYIEKLESELLEWLKLITKTTSKFPYIINENNVNEVATFKTSQLINYLFSHEPPPFTKDPVNTLAKYFSDIKTSISPEVKLQITEIAINEGTTKDFISASLTELVQNSVDAIRSVDAKNRAIKIYYKSEKDSYLFMVEDFVGMPPEAFLYIGVPFLSTKTPSEIVTGEMGSGFFNVYRESSLVIIDTVYNGANYISYDTPVIISYGDNERVVDIDRKIIINSSVPIGRENGTKIIVRSKLNLDKMKISESLGLARYTSEKILSQVSLFEDIKLYVNTFDKIDKRYMFGVGYFDVYFTGNFANMQSTNVNAYPSYIFTKGIPFASISTFYSEYDSRVRLEMEYGVIINIRHGGYTPVQTRTRLNMPDEAKKQFQLILEYAIFVKAMWLLNNIPDKYNYIYQNVNSKGDADQLKVQIAKIDNYEDYKSGGLGLWFGYINFDLLQILNYSKYNTIMSSTNDVIDILGDNFIDDEGYLTTKLFLEKVSNKIIFPPFPEVESLIKRSLTMWADTKNFSSTGGQGNGYNKGKDLNKDKIISPDVPDKLMEPYVKIYIETFISVAVKSNIHGWDKNTVNKIFVVKSEEYESASGYYNNTDRSITINTYKSSNEERKILINNVKNIKSSFDFQNISGVMWQKFFPFKYPATTIPHELEHARRHQSHDTGFHDSIKISMWPGDPPHERTFDQSANDVFSKIISEGFYEELFIKYKNIK
jgi:hypothetical protein